MILASLENVQRRYNSGKKKVSCCPRVLWTTQNFMSGAIGGLEWVKRIVKPYLQAF